MEEHWKNNEIFLKQSGSMFNQNIDFVPRLHKISKSIALWALSQNFASRIPQMSQSSRFKFGHSRVFMKYRKGALQVLRQFCWMRWCRILLKDPLLWNFLVLLHSDECDGLQNAAYVCVWLCYFRQYQVDFAQTITLSGFWICVTIRLFLLVSQEEALCHLGLCVPAQRRKAFDRRRASSNVVLVFRTIGRWGAGLSAASKTWA